MINPQVANVFHEIADLLELSGDNPFRIRAYRRAAMNVEAIPKDVAAMSEEELQSLPGMAGTSPTRSGSSWTRAGSTPTRNCRRRSHAASSRFCGCRGSARRPRAGSIRRWKETVKDIDILAAGNMPEVITNAFVGLPGTREVLERGATKSSLLTVGGIQVDLRVVAEDSFGAALQYFTGSKEHNVRLREMASRRGLKINEYGVFREADSKRLGGREEEDVYKALGLPFVPPELREDAGEIEAAIEGKLPDLVSLADIRGDLHVHTKWSDGAHDLDALVGAVRARKYGYIAITDHSKGLGVAHGLTEDRVREQMGSLCSGHKIGHRIRLWNEYSFSLESVLPA